MNKYSKDIYMGKILTGNFRDVVEVASHVEYSDDLSYSDLEQYTKAINLTTLHLMVLRYQGEGRVLDPKGLKLKAAARIYKILAVSGDDKIGVSVKFAEEILGDIKFLDKMVENNEIKEGDS